jgi:hypothetical protein
LNVWQRINRFLLTYRTTFAAMGRGRVWVPFFCYFALQALVLAWVYLGVRPPMTDFFRLVLGFVVPDAYFHYPGHLALLPVVFYRLLIPFGLFGESLLMAAATWIFIRHFQKDALPGLGASIGQVRFGYPQFIILWLVGFGLLYAWQWGYQATLGDLWIGFQRRRMALEGVREFGKVAVNALFAYATVVILVERTRLGATLTRSVRTFGKHVIATLAFVGLSSLLVYPTNYVLQHADIWFGKFNPEVMVLILLANLLIGSVAAFLVTGVLTLWYLVERQPA